MSKKLPSSWGLKTKKRSDGKLDIIQREDCGRESVVRTTDTSEITDRDLADLKAADRESYPNRDAGVRAQVKRLMGPEASKPNADDYVHQALAFDDSEWIAAAEPVVQAGLGRCGLTVGSTHAYRRGWEYAFGKDN
jgi:hypothetical protein